MNFECCPEDRSHFFPSPLGCQSRYFWHVLKMKKSTGFHFHRVGFPRNTLADICCMYRVLGLWSEGCASEYVKRFVCLWKEKQF